MRIITRAGAAALARRRLCPRWRGAKFAGVAKTAIWGSNQVELWPGMVSAIRVNHLSPERVTGVRGAELATAVAALGDGASQATAFRPRCGLRSMTSRAKRKCGPRGSSPRVKKNSRGATQWRRRRGLAAEAGRSSQSWCSGGPPGSWAPQFSAWSSCGGEQRVRAK